MGTRVGAWILSGLAAAAALPALAGPVEVSFVDADRYFDAGNTKADEETNMKRLATHMQALGQRYLPSQQSLKVEVLQLDLAGETRPSRGGQDVRIARGGADWPRITLRYTLQGEGGSVLRQGEETLSDMNYTWKNTDMRSSEPLRHEKRLLEDWFRKSFATGQASSSGG